MYDTAEGRFTIRDGQLRLDVPDSRLRRTITRLQTTPRILRWLLYISVGAFVVLSLYAVMTVGVTTTFDLLVFVATAVSPLALLALAGFGLVSLAVALRSGRAFGVDPFTDVEYPDRIPLDRITDVSVTTQVNGERTVVIRYETTEDGEEAATVVLTFNLWMRTEYQEAKEAFDEHGLEIAVQ